MLHISRHTVYINIVILVYTKDRNRVLYRLLYGVTAIRMAS